MDWTGLLNWSLQYTDGTRPSEFKPMDEETKHWLREALDTMIVNDVEDLKKGCKILSEFESGSAEEQLLKENAAELILNVVENPDAALNLVKIKGLKDIVKCMIGSQYSSVRKKCASIFTSAVQNNPPVQQNAIEEHALEGLYSRIQNEADLELKEQYMSCISGLVRGEFPVARDNFVELGGLQIVKEIIIAFESTRIVKKSLLMLSDMLHNSKAKGNSNVIDSCKAIGLIEIVSELIGHDDPELVEMVNWTIHNSM